MHCPICGALCKYMFKTNKALRERSANIWRCPQGHGCLVDNCRLTQYTDGRVQGKLEMFRTTAAAYSYAIKG